MIDSLRLFNFGLEILSPIHFSSTLTLLYLYCSSSLSLVLHLYYLPSGFQLEMCPCHNCTLSFMNCRTGCSCGSCHVIDDLPYALCTLSMFQCVRVHSTVGPHVRSTEHGIGWHWLDQRQTDQRSRVTSSAGWHRRTTSIAARARNDSSESQLRQV